MILKGEMIKMYRYLLEFETGNNRTIELESPFNPFSTIWLLIDDDEWINTRFVKRVEYVGKYREDGE